MNLVNEIVKEIGAIVGNKKAYLHNVYLNYLNTHEVLNSIKNNDVSAFGKETYEFESRLKKLTKSPFVVLVSNGSVALDLSLKLLKCNKEDEILLPSFNYIAAANAILNNYAVPHFIEINNQLTIDTVKLEHYLKKNTKIINRKCINIKTGRTISAVICLHTFGHSCDIDRLKKISKKFRLYLIEDAAESLGTYYKKIHTGTVGDVGILSFNGNKILTTGSGGALLLKKKS